MQSRLVAKSQRHSARDLVKRASPLHSIAMCTVVIEVPTAKDGSVRVLAVRDEDPARAWDPPGAWWADRPGVVGVHDRRAGGAWLALNETAGRLAVILNRAERTPDGLPAAPTQGLASRGSLVLDAVAGTQVKDQPGTANFNLVTVQDNSAVVTMWDGVALVRQQLDPGIHMIAHHGVDDPCSARIERWLPEFRALAGAGDDWRERWVELLAQTAELSESDDEAIIRDNNPHGYPTMSLLVCTAEVRGVTDGVQLESAILDTPGQWGQPEFHAN